MTTPQLIIEKLFDDKDLSSDEILFIAKNLNANSTEPDQYDHDNPDTFLACGLSANDVDAINTEFRALVGGQQLSVSQTVQKVETMILSNDKWRRLVILQCVKIANSTRD